MRMKRPLPLHSCDSASSPSQGGGVGHPGEVIMSARGVGIALDKKGQHGRHSRVTHRRRCGTVQIGGLFTRGHRARLGIPDSHRRRSSRCRPLEDLLTRRSAAATHARNTSAVIPGGRACRRAAKWVGGLVGEQVGGRRAGVTEKRKFAPTGKRKFGPTEKSKWGPMGKRKCGLTGR